MDLVPFNSKVNKFMWIKWLNQYDYSKWYIKGKGQQRDTSQFNV